MPHRLSERPEERLENRDPKRKYDYSNGQEGECLLNDHVGIVGPLSPSQSQKAQGLFPPWS